MSGPRLPPPQPGPLGSIPLSFWGRRSFFGEWDGPGHSAVGPMRRKANVCPRPKTQHGRATRLSTWMAFLAFPSTVLGCAGSASSGDGHETGPTSSTASTGASTGGAGGGSTGTGDPAGAGGAATGAGGNATGTGGMGTGGTGTSGSGGSASGG